MIYTVGHSTLAPELFEEMILGNRISVIADVRSHPGSRWPQFQQEYMQDWLPKFGVKYEWWPALGGWTDKHLPLADEMNKHGVDVSAYARRKFPKQRIAGTREQSGNNTSEPRWFSVGLYDYQWFMSLPEFTGAAQKLIERSLRERIALMCCEILPWKCHRSMIADHLVWLGVDSIHLQPKRKHHSEMLGNRLDRYEPEVLASWAPRNSWHCGAVFPGHLDDPCVLIAGHSRLHRSASDGWWSDDQSEETMLPAIRDIHQL